MAEDAPDKTPSSASASTWQMWKWLLVIVFVAIIGAISTWPKFAKRWDRMEQNYEGRQQAWEQSRASDPAPESTPAEETAPIGWIVVGIVLILAIPVAILLVLNASIRNPTTPDREQ